MNKGFTLIELLIVMVIIATLVAVALPKYRVTMERSRAMEAVANVKALAEYANARYIIDNTYSTSISADTIPSKYFLNPYLSISGSSSATIRSSRKEPTSFKYDIVGTVSNGDTLVLECDAWDGDSERICEGLNL